MARKKSSQPFYIYNQTPDSVFGMITEDLLESKQFQSLSYAARCFYMILIVHRNTHQQSTCLFNALREYRDLIGAEWTDDDVRGMAGQNRRWRGGRAFVVMPDKQLSLYGIKKSYAAKLKSELIDAGFLKIFLNDKTGGKNQSYKRAVTIYEFSSEWKGLNPTSL